MNIFLHSTRRQPIRMVLLLLITALMVFAFTARAAEYLLVKQETERLGSYYHAIGQLSYVDQDHGTSADEAISLLENDPRVAFVDKPRYLSAVMQDIYNADIGGPTRFNVGNTKNLDFYFTGIYKDAAGPASGDVLFVFEPEEILNGYPEFIEAGRNVIMVVSRDDAVDTVALVNSLQRGERYLIRGRFEGDASFTFTGIPIRFHAQLLAENAPLFYHIAAGEELDWSDPAISGAAEEMRRCRDEQGALMAVTTKDMSAMPMVYSNDHIHLMDGRWLDSADQAAQNKVCVVNHAFAQVRGLKVGDTITLTFRNVLTSHGYIVYPADGDIPDYETASDTFEIVGIYDYLKGDMQRFTFYRNYAFFVDSAVPASFDAFEDVRTTGDLSFVLTSPALEAEFLTQTQERLSALGLRAEFLENGWADFQAAVRPMLHASLYNLTVFALILPTALCVVAFFYFRARRREIAIARALGVPAGVCVRQGSLPLVLIGFVGTVCGAVSGWQYTLSHGADTLASLSAYGGDTAEISLPYSWLAAIFGGIFLLVLLLALGGMAYLSHRPTLELLQGGAQAKQKKKKAAQASPDMDQETAETQVSAAAWAQPLPAVTTVKRSFSTAHTLRFVGCHIRRSKAKSLLVLLLAALFTAGLAVIQVSILSSTAKVDELYQTVSVSLELVKRNSLSDFERGFIAQSTIDHIADTGFISDFYGEAEYGILNIKRWEGSRLAVGGAPVGLPASSSETRPEVLYSLRSFTDLDSFLSGNGSGVDILYHAGWDESMFSPQDWGTYEEVRDWQSVLPVLLPQEICEGYRITPGERIVMTIERGNGIDLIMEVAGMYTGRVSGGSIPVILTPAGVMDVIMNDSPYYSTACFNLDPAKNRELDTFRAALDGIINANRAGLIPLRALLWDEDLRNAVEPLEDSIRLMEVLYPVALALSLLAAAGVSALLILTEAREAAIMRVLGTTKLRSRIMLVLQIVFMVLAGVLVGLTAALAWSSSAGLALAIFDMSALRAAAYLICAITGSTAGAVTVTNRPPLELLQVKE